MPSPTPTPTPTMIVADSITWIDQTTLWVAVGTLLATVVFALVDVRLRKALAARADFHERYVTAATKAISKKAPEQLQGVRELGALSKEKWATPSDRALALGVMADLDQD